MKKIIYISHFILLISCQAQAQITYQGDDLNEEQLAEGNQEIITSASTIIDGIRLNYKTLSLIKKGEIDRVVLINLTHIFRSSDLKTGDTIIVIFRNVAHGADTMYEPQLHSGYPKMFSRTLPDTNIYCELFLTEFTSRVEIGDHLWKNKKVYELYLTKNGYATI